MKRTLPLLLAPVAAAAAGWFALTSLAPGSWTATWAPCPRNWAWAPAWLPRASPLGRIEFELGDGHGALCFGRPSLAGRTMIGGEAVPYGRLWRLGANEPTSLHLDTPARLGPLDLVPGSYALYAVPEPATWEIVVNRSIRQWGIESEYTDEIRRLEVGRLRVPVEVLDAPVETLTFRTLPTSTGAMDLVLEWQTTRIRLPVEPFNLTE